MRAGFSLTVAALMVMAPIAAAHLFNHGTRHEDCQVYGDPHNDVAGDGHAHTHVAASAASLHNHDPCKQIGMQYPSVVAAGGITEISLEEAALPDGDPSTTEIIIGDEAYRLPVPSLLTQTNVLVNKDPVLAGMGFPGSGTPADPYIIEGYFVKNVLQLRDTSKCVVVRNNVVQSDAIPGPIIDPNLILDLTLVRQTLEDLQEAAAALAAQKAQETAEWVEQADAMAAAAADWEADKAAWDAEADAWDNSVATWEAAYAAFEAEVGALADEYEAYALQYQDMPAPPKTHEAIDDLEDRVPVFGSYLGQLGNYATETAPPEAAPDGFDEDAWLAEKAEHEAYLSAVQDELAAYELELMDSQPSAADRAAFDAERAAFEDAYDAFRTDLSAFEAAYAEFRTVRDAALADADEAVAEVMLQLEGTEDYLFVYAGTLFNTMAELIEKILDELRELLDPVHTGRLVLDWNGQCVHAYNNIVEDLRVNQNNDRTGYATGGVIEQNRFYDIGQIRHYDGEFRLNEVGDRDHLRSLVDPTVVAPAADRSINNDGANEGWFHHNLIYGQVDLDFHGHHHGAGFYSPESHYHGSDLVQGYMRNPDGTYMLDASGQKIPHHNHAKRWTSVLFEDNVVIDPKGVGLRFEDQNHRGDDARANSENMAELNKPHFHRTWVRMLDNVVVGKMSVDIFNADGVDLWTDTYTEAKTGLVDGTVDAVQHLGADIVNSHPERNNGWLDIQGNSVFLVGPGAAFRVSQAKEMDGFALKSNRGYAVGAGAAIPLDEEQLVDFLRAAPTGSVSAVYSQVQSWGGAPTGATAVLLDHVKDSSINVCSNAMRGFARGLQATMAIYDTTTITTCPSNTWGSADPAVSLEFTPTPATGTGVTQPVRDVTDATPAKYVARPALTEVDRTAAGAGL